MKQYNIDDYDLFIFDFDGTILDTESYHYEAYMKTFKDLGKNIELDIQNYFGLLHNIDKSHFYSFLKDLNIGTYDELHKIKSKNFLDIMNNTKVDYIGNIENFLNKLKSKNKELIIVTNSSEHTMNNLKKDYKLLNLFDKIYTKDNFTKKKPDPECYLKIQEIYKGKRMIGFEDSYQGFHALSFAKSIKPFFICAENYYYNDTIRYNYEVEIINNYDCFN